MVETSDSERDIQLGDNYVDNLFLLTGAGLKSGLDHIRTYLRKKGNPHHTLQVFHVAGTNGKGSVCNMLAQTLHKQFGKKIGLFTSPHLVHITERIQINNELIPRDTLNTLLKEIYQETKDICQFSYFELLTLAAVRYFIEEQVDYVVCETGLGGRLDSTNIWKQPVATYITSIGLDHKRLLGPTLTQIQRNKMGIMKSGVPCYTVVDNGLMREGARRKHAVLHTITSCISTSLPGEHQEMNAGLVYESLVDLGFDADKVRAGLLDVSHAGRLEYIAPNILLDGAHNTQGLEQLGIYIDSIRSQWSNIITVFGTSKNPDEVEDFAHLLIQGDKNIIVQPSVFRGLDPLEYIRFLNMYVTLPVGNPAEIVKHMCLELSGDTLLVIYGSLYLIGEVYPIVQEFRNKKTS